MSKVVKLYEQYVLPYRHQVYFVLFGGCLFLLNASLQFLVKEKLGVSAGITNIIVTIPMYILQFVLNAVYTWGDRSVAFKKNLIRAGKYVPIKIVLWSLNTGLNLMFLYIGLHYQIANALAVLAIMVINYFVFDKVIFTNE